MLAVLVIVPLLWVTAAGAQPPGAPPDPIDIQACLGEGDTPQNVVSKTFGPCMVERGYTPTQWSGRTYYRRAAPSPPSGAQSEAPQSRLTTDVQQCRQNTSDNADYRACMEARGYTFQCAPAVVNGQSVNRCSPVAGDRPPAAKGPGDQWSSILQTLADVAATLGSNTNQDVRGARRFAYTVEVLQFLSGAVGGQDGAKSLALAQLRGEQVFSDANWNALRAVRREVIRNVVTMAPSGQQQVGDVEVAWVTDLPTVNRWCNTLHVHANACGCVKTFPPQRIVAYVGTDPSCDPRQRLDDPTVASILRSAPALRSATGFELAHELWHLKGYWGHIPSQNWPAHGATAAPVRMPTTVDVYPTR